MASSGLMANGTNRSCSDEAGNGGGAESSAQAEACPFLLILLMAGVVFAQEATFKVDVRLVRLIATVKDTGGKPVGGMEKGDFSVLDNGVEQNISFVRTAYGATAFRCRADRYQRLGGQGDEVSDRIGSALSSGAVQGG